MTEWHYVKMFVMTSKTRHDAKKLVMTSKMSTKRSTWHQKHVVLTTNLWHQKNTSRQKVRIDAKKVRHHVKTSSSRQNVRKTSYVKKFVMTSKIRQVRHKMSYDQNVRHSIKQYTKYVMTSKITYICVHHYVNKMTPKSSSWRQKVLYFLVNIPYRLNYFTHCIY